MTGESEVTYGWVKTITGMGQIPLWSTKHNPHHLNLFASKNDAHKMTRALSNEEQLLVMPNKQAVAIILCNVVKVSTIEIQS